jgi:hypothetical protein
LSINLRDFLTGQWALIELGHSTQDLGFTFRTIKHRNLPVRVPELYLRDIKRAARSLVQLLQYFSVELIDPGSQIIKAGCFVEISHF